MADIGHGATITFSGFTAEYQEIDGPSIERDAVETTHMTSTGGYRTFMPGMIDMGEVTCQVNFDPNTNPPQAGAAGTLTITWPVPEGGSTGAQWSCSAFVTGYKPTAPVDDRMTAEITWKLTSVPTFTDST